MTMLHTTWRSLLGGPSGLVPWLFDPALATFTQNMGKRAAPGPFTAAPILQGSIVDTSEYDRATWNRTEIHGAFATVQDNTQGSFVFWYTPELFSSQTICYLYYSTGTYIFYNDSSQEISFVVGGSTLKADASAMVAGGTYCIIARWDSLKPLDGTNHACVSIDDTHTFGGPTSAWSAVLPTGQGIGGYGPKWAPHGIVEGFTIYRRVLYDGAYGVDVGNGDEVALISAGVDPTTITKGSWDGCFCLPTDCDTDAELDTTGEAWSHPHSSAVLDHTWNEDGYYGGGPWAIAANGSSTAINCGSDAGLDDLPDGGAATWEGWFRIEDTTPDCLLFCKNPPNSFRLYLYNATIYAHVKTDGSSATITLAEVSRLTDSKWHHVALTYDDLGDRKLYLWIDGVLRATSGAATGTYVTDAGNNFMISGNGYAVDGAIGWCRVSDSVRYTADFVPAREPPAPDGNTVAQWNMSEGTGVTVDNAEGTAARDGTISNGTWEPQWDEEGTIVEPYSLEFDGDDDNVNCGSAADIDDLFSGDCTLEWWYRADTWGQLDNGGLGIKGDMAVGTGWAVYGGLSTGPRVRVWVRFDNTDINSAFSGEFLPFGQWNHVAIVYDSATKSLDVYYNGIVSHTGTKTGVGNYVSDAAEDLLLGEGPYTRNYDGGIGWFRASDIKRYTDTFCPPSRLNPPATDGNTLRQFNFRDGAGTTLTDETATANGTISGATWKITPDMAVDAPGARVYGWGYTVGVDAANEGIVQAQAGLDAGENYVLRPVISYEADKRAQPAVVAYDETNGAAISTYKLPQLYGQHDGGDGESDLADSSAPYWPASLVGGTVYNITDGSSATITAAGDSIVGALGGGTDDDWDDDDYYMIVPPSKWVFADPFTFELPTNARNGVASDCTALSIKVINLNDEGVFYVHQAELQENLIDNPSLETGAGDPWEPDGWIDDVTLDSGDTEQELTIVHSGAACLQFNTGAVSNEFLRLSPDNAWPTAGEFHCYGGWYYCPGGDLVHSASQNGRVYRQRSATADIFYQDNREAVAANSEWEHVSLVVRIDTAYADPVIAARTGATGARYVDDIYDILLDAVTLTVTAATKANSTEADGLRVDGHDLCWQAVDVPPGNAYFRFNVTTRHAAALLKTFNSDVSPLIFYAWGDANNWITLDVSAANTIRLWVNAAGAAASNTWDCTGAIVAGTTYVFEIQDDAGTFRLLVDGVERISITPGVPDTPFSAAYLGCSPGSAQQTDIVFGAP